MIEIKNFTKSYPDVPLYDNFNLVFREGEVACVLGESGSGKTTLLNAIAGLTEYDGYITKLKSSYIFQTPRLIPNLTVYGNLKIICDDDSKIRNMLDRVHLADKAGSYPVNLSGGQAQRVAIARAFLFESDVILMDEPFSSLDLKLKEEMTELFLAMWRDEKRTAVFVTHDMDEAISISDRIIVLNKGKIIYDKNMDGVPLRPFGSAEALRRELICVLKGE